MGIKVWASPTSGGLAVRENDWSKRAQTFYLTGASGMSNLSPNTFRNSVSVLVSGCVKPKHPTSTPLFSFLFFFFYLIFSSVYLPYGNWHIGNFTGEKDYQSGSFWWPELRNLILWLMRPPECTENQGHSNKWSATFIFVGVTCVSGWLF